MQRLKVKHLKSGSYIAERAELANTFYTRLVGLMFAKTFGDRDGIWFQPSNSIHTFFCKFPIDVIFVNSNNKVVKIYKELKPWRLTPIIFKASRVLELPPNSIKNEIKVGDELEVIYV